MSEVAYDLSWFRSRITGEVRGEDRERAAAYLEAGRAAVETQRQAPGGDRGRAQAVGEGNRGDQEPDQRRDLVDRRGRSRHHRRAGQDQTRALRRAELLYWGGWLIAGVVWGWALVI